ncbi:MAG TPA: phage terminase large subunit, partial [Puia sp.]|nr:phage terminase large subunit [Puia sp.]
MKPEGLRPQSGPQEEFLKNNANIVVYGGAAGGGKTFALLLECLRWIKKSNFSAVIFRRTSTQVRNSGGLWDTSTTIYPIAKGFPRESRLEWIFPSGSKISFANMEYDKDRFNWQGSQIPLIGFDELTHFTWSQFMYMFSRNRSVSGIPSYIRATTNPDPDSWVRKMIEWWINDETGYAIPERSGKIRWFVVENDKIIWGNTREELLEGDSTRLPKSFSFIASTVFDNKILLEKDPGYLASLKALSRFEREQLLMGNWNVRPSAGMFFQRSYFEVINVLPKNLQFVRYWDRAATKKTENNDPDYTVGLKMAKDINGIFYVCDIVRLQESPLQVQNAIKNTASQDSHSTRIGLEQDPGQAGTSEVDLLIRMLSGYNVKPYKTTKDKVTRASPVSAQAEAGNIRVLRGHWNED